MKGEFELVFNDNQDCNYIITSMIDNTTFISWSNYLREAISNLKEERYDFNHIAEMDIVTLAHKRDKTYDSYLKHKMSDFEWKLKAMINKDNFFKNHFPQDWLHSIITKFERYRNSNN